MPHIKLNMVKANGPGFPNNTVAEFRFNHSHIHTITIPQHSTWLAFPAGTWKPFTSSGSINLYMGGDHIDTSSTSINETPVTNKECYVSCIYGLLYVKYTVF